MTNFPVLPSVGCSSKLDLINDNNHHTLAKPKKCFLQCCWLLSQIEALETYATIVLTESHTKVDCITHAKDVVPVHRKLRLSRLLSQDICNILIHTNNCQKNDFALYTILQEFNFDSIDSNMQNCFMCEIIFICHSQCCSMIHWCNGTLYQCWFNLSSVQIKQNDS